MADRWGRKWAVTATAFLIIMSGACLAGSANPTMFIIFRFFSGAGRVNMIFLLELSVGTDDKIVQA